jgi:hypothetical protein
LCASCCSASAAALLSFKQALDAADAVKLNWQPGSDHCQWLGVYCNAVQRVYLLDLSNLGLQGTLSEAVKLGGLQQLQSIWLQGNRLAGSLPASWFMLPSLQELMLYDNALQVSCRQLLWSVLGADTPSKVWL